MTEKQKWLWETYLAIILIFAIQKVYRLFNPGSSDFLYYAILRTFDPYFYIAYAARVTYVFLNLVHCVPLFLYIARIKFLNQNLWKCLFILRCIFELAGQSYEANTFIALSHSSPKLLLFLIVYTFGPAIPSYCACYQYAFSSRTK
jgi:hypothetical protein